mgnify:CR=1 FL=1|tara:strand:- start:1073 stop:1519 length:447 start_codon:yes stop_codon:yes gene_type:complete
MKLFKFFKKKKAKDSENVSVSFDFELTAAVLAYEIARIDGEVDEDELKILMNELVLIANKTNKDESEILEIIESYSKNSVSFHDFIEDINKEYSKDQKINLLRFMWDVAYADSKLDIEEERLIRRIADLIKIKDIEVLKLKDNAKTEF